MAITVLHVARGFSAQPTLGACLDGAEIVELDLAEALVSRTDPDVVWASSASSDNIRALRRRFPTVAVLATPDRSSPVGATELLAAGADLVLRDEGVVVAAAALEVLARRVPVPA